jgi:hypothetical protein
MKLAAEIPTKYLTDWSPLFDLDFALAHKVIENKSYERFYAGREKGRQLILDNSMHELGRPMEPIELEEACKRVNPDYIIAPDMLGEVEQNYEWYVQTSRLLGSRCKIAVVMCGRSSEERELFLGNVREASLLCLPFREDRLLWYREHHKSLERWDRVHLLGVSTPEDLRWFSNRAKRDTPFRWSVDTSKPIKWGLQRKLTSTLPTLRGCPLSSAELLDVDDVDENQLVHIFHNIAHLRTLMA